MTKLEENKKISIEEYLELNKRINEQYHQNFLEYNNRLTLVQSTKAWKIMCFFRRINEQFLKGNSSEKKKFLKWLTLKLQKNGNSIRIYNLFLYTLTYCFTLSGGVGFC